MKTQVTKSEKQIGVMLIAALIFIFFFVVFDSLLKSNETLRQRHAEDSVLKLKIERQTEERVLSNFESRLDSIYVNTEKLKKEQQKLATKDKNYEDVYRKVNDDVVSSSDYELYNIVSERYKSSLPPDWDFQDFIVRGNNVRQLDSTIRIEGSANSQPTDSIGGL